MIQNEKTLRKDALSQYLDGGLKEASIVSQVTNGKVLNIKFTKTKIKYNNHSIILQHLLGKNAMPAFGGRLDDDEISNVAAYVYDQASGSKWD